MSDAIFLLQGQSLTPMSAQAYESEALLQQLLADYPDLLAGGQMDRVTPRRWVLIRREMGVPDEQDGPGRWSLDHLFVDQDGIPTMVEVKRASDARIRREVVGQMLDYAANGIRYWPAEDLRAELTQRCSHKGIDVSQFLIDQLGIADVDEFWVQVRQNLEVGRVRLVFVADVIPPALQRIIEFLNDQMHRSQVVGLEVQQYVAASGVRTLVPRVIGMTSQAQVAKGKRQVLSYEEAMASAVHATREFEKRILAWCEREGHRSSVIRNARRFETSEGWRILLLYPAANYAEFRIGRLQDTGLHEEAKWLLDALGKYARSSRTGRSPSVGCPALLENWADFESTFLPKYIAARREAFLRAAAIGTSQT